LKNSSPSDHGLNAKASSNVPGSACSIFSSSSAVNPARFQRLPVDARRIVQAERAHDVLQDVVDLLRRVTEVHQRRRSDWFAILK
jgi:hypothetical protein